MPLKFVPKISQYANLYFFIQNLSEWHLSNRKDHNKEWRARLTFSDKIDSYLLEFKKIHKRFPFGDKYLGRPFFLSDDPWPATEALVGKKEMNIIKEIFSEIEPYFNMIYKEEEAKLENWETIISSPKFIAKASRINSILADFYGCSPYDKKCNIYLLLSTKNKNGGTAGTIDDKTITLELSQVSQGQEIQITNIVWHELIHLYFRKFKLYPLLQKYTDNDHKVMGEIDELIASAFLPNGLIKNNSLGPIIESQSPEKFNARINTGKIIRTQKSIYSYLQEKRTIDAKLVKKLLLICNISSSTEVSRPNIRTNTFTFCPKPIKILILFFIKKDMIPKMFSEYFVNIDIIHVSIKRSIE